jgi:hypothetical protein
MARPTITKLDHQSIELTDRTQLNVEFDGYSLELHMTKRAAPIADEFPTLVSSWQDLASIVEHFSQFNGHDWLFRGVTDDAHKLIPKIGRPRAKKSRTPKTTPYTSTDEHAVLRLFMQQARAHLPSPHSLLEWLAIAQHFGIPTRLLDWSDSVLVAAWFAVQDASGKECDAAIWVTRHVPAQDPDFSGNPIAIDEARLPATACDPKNGGTRKRPHDLPAPHGADHSAVCQENCCGWQAALSPEKAAGCLQYQRPNSFPRPWWSWQTSGLAIRKQLACRIPTKAYGAFRARRRVA